MFLMTYLLLKRRRDISYVDMGRRREIQRRIRHRHYFFQRQRRMLMVSVLLRSSFFVFQYLFFPLFLYEFVQLVRVKKTHTH